jgi:hypothetical protein
MLRGAGDAGEGQDEDRRQEPAEDGTAAVVNAKPIPTVRPASNEAVRALGKISMIWTARGCGVVAGRLSPMAA